MGLVLKVHERETFDCVPSKLTQRQSAEHEVAVMSSPQKRGGACLVVSVDEFLRQRVEKWKLGRVHVSVQHWRPSVGTTGGFSPETNLVSGIKFCRHTRASLEALEGVSISKRLGGGCGS